MEQQRKRYASDPKVREKKKIYYEKEMKKQKNLELVEKHKENCRRLEKIARERNSEGLKWLQDSFEKVFKEFKNVSNETKERIIILEKSIKDKFTRIDSEINFKVEKYLFEVENYSYNIRVDINAFHYIFKDFITLNRLEKPLHEQNRIDLKQTIQVKLESMPRVISDGRFRNGTRNGENSVSKRGILTLTAARSYSCPT